MDQELFELCKDVYERTRWADGDSSLQWWLKYFYAEGKYDLKLQRVEDEKELGKYDVPLYTSDYLLEKLPKTLYTKDNADQGHELMLYVGKYTGKWFAGYKSYFGGQIGEQDTPLKALLKLTIALHEAGELK